MLHSTMPQQSVGRAAAPNAVRTGKCSVTSHKSRRNVRRAATADPENLYKGIPQATGIIERRLMKQRLSTDKEFASQFQVAMTRFQNEELATAEMRRNARTPPTDPTDLVEYFLDTAADDMEYEVARCRLQLQPTFFQHLDKLIGAERFAQEPDQDRLAELETLRQFLEAAVVAVDTAVSATTSAVERMKRLLSAPDKKQMILDMAAANEIDGALIDLLGQNIEAARGAGQEEAAAFMEKVRVAAGKYMVNPVAKSPILTPATAKKGVTLAGVEVPLSP